jgi:hypothetical protein
VPAATAGAARTGVAPARGARALCVCWYLMIVDNKTYNKMHIHCQPCCNSVRYAWYEGQQLLRHVKRSGVCLSGFITERSLLQHYTLYTFTFTYFRYLSITFLLYFVGISVIAILGNTWAHRSNYPPLVKE